jgi:probable selenium-dependent hydroxylase accessory protein YqeC
MNYIEPGETALATVLEQIQQTSRPSMAEALGLKDQEVISLIGAGGKSKFMTRLAAELAGAERCVVITSTTRMCLAEIETASSLVIEDNVEDALRAISTRCIPGQIIAVGRTIDVEGKLVGVPAEWVTKFSKLSCVSHMIVEADWAKGRSLAVSGFREPVVPSCTTQLVCLAGIDVLGKPITAEYHGRPDVVSEIIGAKIGDPLTPDAMAKVIIATRRKAADVPRHCGMVTVLNKVDNDELRQAARQVASRLLEDGMKRVILSSCSSPEPIVDIVEPSEWLSHQFPQM